MFDVSTAGHRQSYLTVMSAALQCGYHTGHPLLNVRLLLRFRTLVWASCDYHLLTFLLFGLLRTILHRQTVGIGIAVEAIATKRGIKWSIKRMLLSLVEAVDTITIVSIIPHHVIPLLEKYTSDWILDPQFWDLSVLTRGEPIGRSADLISDVKRHARGRIVVASAGTQSLRKGVDRFMRLFVHSLEIRERALFVCAGDASQLSSQLKRSFVAAGGMLLDRRITEQELFGLYESTDVVWAWYRPYYDQSSGIVGRAVQLGKTVMVREGSHVQRLFEFVAMRSPVALRLEEDADRAEREFVGALSVAMEHVRFDSGEFWLRHFVRTIRRAGKF